MYDGTGRGDWGGGALTAEEIQDLLAPLEMDADTIRPPVLVLADDPGDLELVVTHLMARDVPVVPAQTWDEALERLGVRPYAGVVAAAGALPAEPGEAVAHLHRLHPGLGVCLVVEPFHEVRSVPATVAVRPRVEEGLDRFLRRLAQEPGGEPGREPALPSGAGSAPGAAAERRRMRVVEPGAVDEAAPDGSPAQQPPPPGPDPLLAVQALLEAKSAGEDLAAGLRRWAERDPAILGVAECHLDEREWRLRATTPVAGERHRMLLLLLEQLETPVELSGEPATAGPFSLFPLYRSPRSCVALWHQRAASGAALLRRLRPLLPLIEALPEAGRGDAPQVVRERFIALLESRMRATDRGRGQLGILLVEAPAGENPALLCGDLKEVLRGGDWIEVVGTRLYVILDHPGQGTLDGISARLQQLSRREPLRAVALAWDPGLGRAEALVGRAERLLEEWSEREPVSADGRGGAPELPGPRRRVGGAGTP